MKSLLLFLLLSLGLYSCSKNVSDNGCSACHPVLPDKVISVSVGSVDKTFNVYVNDGRENNNNYVLADAKATFSNKELNEALSAVGVSYTDNINPADVIGAAFFVDKDLSKTGASTSLQRGGIKAVFIYFVLNNKPNVKVFRGDETAMVEVPELAAETGYISYNDLEMFTRKFFNNGATSMSVVAITDHSRTGDYKGARNHFSTKVSKYAGVGR